MWLVFLDGPVDCQSAYEAASQNNIQTLTLWLERNPLHDDGDEHIKCIDISIESIVESILNKVSSHQILGVLTFSDALVPLAGKLNNFFKLKSPYSFRHALLSKNKLEMRELLKYEKLNPIYHTIKYNEDKKINEVDKFNTLDFSNPWILKPIFGHSSIGVTKVKSHEELILALPEVAKANIKMVETIKGIDDEFKDYIKSTFLIESYFDGIEFSVEMLILDRKIIPLEVCSKTEMKDPFFEEITYMAPADCNITLRNQLFDAAKKIINLMGVNNTCTHQEFRWNGKQLCFLDIGLRAGGGGLTQKLIELSSGKNLLGAWFAALKGQEFNENLISKINSVALLYLDQVRNGGIIKRTHCRDLPQEITRYLKEQKEFVKIGDLLTGYPNYSGLPGYVLYQVPFEKNNFPKQLINSLVSESMNYFDPVYEEDK